MMIQSCRWVLPFSRQFTTTFVTYIPFLPWRWKMALLKTYLSSFYKSAGVLHMMPTGDNMDYTGESNGISHWNIWVLNLVKCFSAMSASPRKDPKSPFQGIMKGSQCMHPYEPNTDFHQQRRNMWVGLVIATQQVVHSMANPF